MNGNCNCFMSNVPGVGVPSVSTKALAISNRDAWEISKRLFVLARKQGFNN